jgi:hypothetical protein
MPQHDPFARKEFFENFLDTNRREAEHERIEGEETCVMNMTPNPALGG